MGTEQLTCPICRQELPAGETFCRRCMSDVLDHSPSVSEPEVSESTDAGTSGATDVTCQNCGDRGQPGQECRQCRQILLVPITSRAASVRLLFPSGAEATIPTDTEVMIGRQSEIPAVRQTLASFDVVSRVHCYLTVDSTANQITVRDPGSANHTWVGDDPLEVGTDEFRVAPLPSRIRLGRSLAITISGVEADR